MPKMLKVILTPTDKSVSFAIKADYEEIIDKERQRSAVCENQMTEIYGRKFVRSQDRFLLAPIQATLNNEESIWITAQLILFSNKMAVLRIKFPLINVGIQPLLDNNYDEYISTLNSDLDIRKNRFSLNEVINFYLEHLHNDCGIGITLHDFPITHIVIVDYPENRRPFEQISSCLMKQLCRILYAPIPPTLPQFRLKLLEDELTADGFVNYGLMSYFLGSTGRILSLATNKALSAIRVEETECSCDKFEFIAESMITNIEFSILVNMLRKLNQLDLFASERDAQQDYDSIQEKYLANSIYIAELQESCYGSASELTEKVRQRMQLYLRESLSLEKLDSLSTLRNMQSIKEKEQQQSWLAKIGLIAALLFGLPSIKEILEIVNEALGISAEMSICTEDQAGIFIWILVLGAIVLYLKNR